MLLFIVFVLIELSTMATPKSPSPVFISATTLKSILTHKSLIDHFQISLPTLSPTAFTSPPRHNYTLSPSSSSLLLMPSWSSSPSLPYVGVKLVTCFPNNSSVNLPGIHANYSLFSSLNGQTLASIDGTELTLWRTSCVSGLASKLLSSPHSETLIMIGAGSLAPHLIKAHLSSRPSLRKVIIWNRTIEKATTLVLEFRNLTGYASIEFETGSCLDEIIGLGDIVSCATNSKAALVKGKLLKKGAHLDLVGSFQESMKECDDEAIKRGRVFVDCDEAFFEAGELVGAFERGVIRKEDVGGKLVELIKGGVEGRRVNDVEMIAVFKSVGSAVFDLLAAQFVYEAFTSEGTKFNS